MGIVQATKTAALVWCASSCTPAWVSGCLLSHWLPSMLQSLFHPIETSASTLQAYCRIYGPFATTKKSRLSAVAVLPRLLWHLSNYVAANHSCR